MGFWENASLRSALAQVDYCPYRVLRSLDGANGAAPGTQVGAGAPRRQFTAQYKLSIVEQADRCQGKGKVGALLRREGLYSSHLSEWWRLRNNGILKGLNAQQRGPKSDGDVASKRELARLQKAYCST